MPLAPVFDLPAPASGHRPALPRLVEWPYFNGPHIQDVTSALVESRGRPDEVHLVCQEGGAWLCDCEDHVCRHGKECAHITAVISHLLELAA